MPHGDCRILFGTQEKSESASSINKKPSFGPQSEIKLKNSNSSKIAVYRLILSITADNIKE